MSRASISYCGIPMDVEYDYEAGYLGSWTEPPEPAQAAISAVFVGSVDLYDLLSFEQLSDIECLILEARSHGREEDTRDYEAMAEAV